MPGFDVKRRSMSYQSLFEKLNQQDLILTANARLARVLMQKWITWRGQCISERPNIESWSAYFLKQYDQLSWEQPALPRVLTPEEEACIWTGIIQHSDSALGLIQPEATAKTVMRAYKILRNWNLTLLELKKLNQTDSPEVAYFLNWATEFETQCELLKVIGQEDIYLELSKSSGITCLLKQSSLRCGTRDQVMPDDSGSSPSTIYLIGFDSLSPLMQKVLDQLELTGIKIELFKFSPKAECAVLPCLNREQEWENLAVLAKYYADQNLSVGVVIPEMVNCREEVLNAFFKILEPEKLLTLHPIPEKFALTGGVPLGSVPVISTGLNLLKNPESLFFLRLPQWRQFFLNQLKQSNWPGEFTLTSFEHQAVVKFYEQIEAWLSLSFLMGECDCQQARESLKQWLEGVFFQPESESEVLINLYGPLEISGLEQEVILVANMNDSSFPARAEPNPYLPYDLQQNLNMPHATPSRELNFAEALIQEWQSLSGKLIALYSEKDGDLDLRMSPLIQDWPVLTIQSDIFNDYSEKQELHNISQEVLDQSFGPPITNSELAEIKGGVGIFKSQAACPFQAFAKYRLKIIPIEDSPEPLNLKSRGIVTHQILEKLMPRIFNISGWKQKSVENFEVLIEEVVSSGLEQLAKSDPVAMPKFFKKLEQARLVELMKAWIQIEQGREEFELLDQERELFGWIAEIPIRARVDRVDQVEQGKIIIDYKTGKPSLSACLGERPDEPQLPIYSLLLKADGIGYASLNIQNLILETLDSEIFKNHQKQWIQSFESLAREFKQGWAVLDPKKGESTCSQCDFTRLCRRHEKSGEREKLG